MTKAWQENANAKACGTKKWNLTPTTSAACEPSRRLLDHLAERRTTSLHRTDGRSVAGPSGKRPARPLPGGEPAIAGNPAMFTVTVKMSLRYISTGSAPLFRRYRMPPMASPASGIASHALGETVLKILLDQSGGLSCCARRIIGVVVTGREHVSADHDPAADFGAKNLRRGLFSYISPMLAARQRRRP